MLNQLQTQMVAIEAPPPNDPEPIDSLDPLPNDPQPSETDTPSISNSKHLKKLPKTTAKRKGLFVAKVKTPQEVSRIALFCMMML